MSLGWKYPLVQLYSCKLLWAKSQHSNKDLLQKGSTNIYRSKTQSIVLKKKLKHRKRAKLPWRHNIELSFCHLAFHLFCLFLGPQVSKVTLCVKILKWQSVSHSPRSGIELPGQLKNIRWSRTYFLLLQFYWTLCRMPMNNPWDMVWRSINPCLSD